MTLNGFSSLVFVPPALKVYAEIKRMILHYLLPPHSPIGAFKNKVYYDLAITLYY